MFELELIATKGFNKAAKKYLSTEEVEELAFFLSENPEHGKMIINTGGIRKLRWKSKRLSKGKRGGLRVIYSFHLNKLIILLDLYSKSNKKDLSNDDKEKVLKLLGILLEQWEKSNDKTR